MIWSSVTNVFSCASISIASTQVTGLDDNYIKQGGNSLGAAATIGTNDAQSLVLETNNGPRVTINSSGNVGIGRAPTSYLVDVNGTLNANEIRVGGSLISSGVQGAITTVAVLGNSCSTVGQLAKDASGNLMVCDDTPSALTTADCSALGVGAVTFDENGEIYVCAN